MNATLSPTLKTRLGFNPIFLVKMAAIHGLVTNPDPMSPVRNKWREAAILAGKTARGTDRKTKRNGVIWTPECTILVLIVPISGRRYMDGVVFRNSSLVIASDGVVSLLAAMRRNLRFSWAAGD